MVAARSLISNASTKTAVVFCWQVPLLCVASVSLALLLVSHSSSFFTPNRGSESCQTSTAAVTNAAASTSARGCSDSSPSGALFDPAKWQASFHPGSMTWAPSPGRFLLMFCYHGQISNRALCFRNHLALAGLLNRTLVVPSKPEDVNFSYNLEIAFDFHRLRQCYGSDVILTTDEFFRKYGHPIQIGRILCWHAPGPTCHIHFDDLYHNCPAKGVGSAPTRATTSHLLPRLIAGSMDSGYQLEGSYFYQKTVKLPEDKVLYTACLPQFAPLQFVIDAYAAVPDEVLVAGDLHNVFFSDWPEFKASLDLPFVREPACQDALVIRPAEGIFQAALSAQEEMFGREPYVSVHWRRGDFKEWCALLKNGACYFPPKQVAWFIVQQLYDLGIQNVYLATNGEEGEVVVLAREVAQLSNSTVTVKSLAQSTSQSSKWRRDVRRLAQDGQGGLVFVSVEKILCARGEVFFGSPISTFTKDISRMRHGLRTAHCRDTTLCYGQKEWVIEENK